MSKKNKNRFPKTVNSSSQTTSPKSTMTQSKKTLIAPKKSFTAKLKLLTDWHIGSGAGRTGDIDSLIKRDHQNFPYIPAKTLTGIWRDACELVAFGLDNGLENTTDNCSWQKWVNYLFGDQPTEGKQPEKFPRQASLSVRSAHLSDPFRQALQDKPELKNALTFVKPGIEIDPQTGCTIQDHLLFQEMVRGGTKLQAKCELNLENLSEDQQKAAYGLLILGTKLVERLGAKRRRGSGQCELVVVEDIKPWIDWIEEHPTPPNLPNLPDQSLTDNGGKVEGLTDKNWILIRCQLTTKTAVIVPTKTVGNIVKTLDYIPGTYLLPIISKKLRQLVGQSDINWASLIANGNLIVTNATLEINGEKGRPVPFALFGEKLDGGLEKGCKVYNRFLEKEPEKIQLKGERVGYIGSIKNNYLPQHGKVNLTVGTHNTIQDDVQRPTSDVGGVYSYEAIPPGTILQFELKLRKSIYDALPKNWQQCLQGEIRLGQSKKDDYGQVKLEVLPENESIKTTPKNNKSELTIWLLSDVLLRDKRLRPTTSLDDLGEQLSERLGLTLKLKESNNDDKLSVIARQNRVESWQVRWGLPRPSLVGLGAGTCAIFEVVKGTIDPLKITEVQNSGIGERRAEGYGQICFNEPVLCRETSQLEAEVDNKDNKKKPPQQLPLIKLEDCEFPYARIVEKAAWREAINRAALEFAANSDRFRIQRDQPKMSQLGALRSVLRRLEKPENSTEPGVILKWLKQIEKTPNRKDKWRAETLQEIRSLITDETEVWKRLNFDCSQLTLTSTGERDLKGQQWRSMTNDQWKASDQLWTETVQILVDACIRAHKRDIEPNRNSNQEQE